MIILLMAIVAEKTTDITSKDESDELEDVFDRLNALEANMVESKEFTHLSAEVFAILQNQINELKIVIANMIKGTSEAPVKKEGLYL